MARAPLPAVNPAADAAALLRRLGFGALMLALPIAAMLTRRGVVILAPIAIALIVIAAMLDPGPVDWRSRARRAIATPAAAAVAIVVLWSALSLAWTPFAQSAADRLFSVVATIALAGAGYLALPERMRAANLYLVPIGTAAAALVAIGLSMFGGVTGAADADGRSLERGLIVLVLFVWPSVAWLRSRDRDVEALLLAVVVAVAAALGPQPIALMALAAGAAAYALTAIAPHAGVRATALVTAGLLAAAPLIPFVVRPIVGATAGKGVPLFQILSVWRRVILDEPVRLVTGHGFETALRGRTAGLLPPAAPNTVLFEAWYELGLVGALGGAAALYFAITGAGREHAPLLPGVMAAFATVFCVACLGVGTAQMAWFTAVVVLVLVFVATERGQFRTTRPKASFVARPRPANDA